MITKLDIATIEGFVPLDMGVRIDEDHHLFYTGEIKKSNIPKGRFFAPSESVRFNPKMSGRNRRRYDG